MRVPVMSIDRFEQHDYLVSKPCAVQLFPRGLLLCPDELFSCRLLHDICMYLVLLTFYLLSIRTIIFIK